MLKPRMLAPALVCLLMVAWVGNAGATGSAATVKPKASAGCGRSTVGPGEERVTTTSGGVPRAYFRDVPPGYDGQTPLALVLDLHGASEPAALHKTNSGLAVFGDQHGFVTLTPEGPGPTPHWDTHYGSADVKFLGNLLDEVEHTLCIDERRVFVAGYSNGAFMASVLACVAANRIAAVAPVAGIRAVPGCKPARRVPVVAFHGIADPFVSFKGGLGPGVASLPPADRQNLTDLAAPTDSGKSVPGVAAAWAKRNGCGSKPERRAIAADVTLVRYRCPNRADVQLYEIKGGGHTWPDSQFSKSIESVVGKTTFSIDADAIMWKFFQAHPLRSQS